MECPRCKLLSPEGTASCDCGYQLNLPFGMQPSSVRQPIERSSRHRQVGVLVVIAVAVMWGVYLLRWDSGNNLYGIFLLVLIPLSAVLLIIAGILMVSATRTPSA